MLSRHSIQLTTQFDLPQADSPQISEIDLLEVEIDIAADWRNWYSLLSQDERARSQRYRRSYDRQQFVTARGLLRQYLGSYLDISPEQICFQYGDRGKPSLAPELQSRSGDAIQRSLYFNTSHSGGVLLLAFAWDIEIGVDLEVPREINDLLELAQCFFFSSEVEELEKRTESERSTLFFQYWTCKEAYLKATGVGLLHLEQTPIVWDDNHQPRPFIYQNGQVGRIQTVSLHCGYPGAIAAIAIS